MPEFDPSTGVDARLGDGLYRVCAMLHYLIAEEDGWLKLLGGSSVWGSQSQIDSRTIDFSGAPDQCQTSVVSAQGKWLLFAPSGGSTGGFQHCISRINAATDRPGGLFPEGVNSRGVDLSGVNLNQITFHRMNLCSANFEGASLTHGSIYETQLVNANLRKADLSNTVFEDVGAESANLEEAKLEICRFRNTSIRQANLKRTNCNFASFDNSDLEGVIFDQSLLFSCDLRFARGIEWKQLRPAFFDDTTLMPAEFKGRKQRVLRKRRAQSDENDHTGP